MIHYVSGDILLSRAQAVAHGVAPKDPMNQGLARSLHEKYPAMHKDYHHWCYTSTPSSTRDSGPTSRACDPAGRPEHRCLKETRT